MRTLMEAVGGAPRLTESLGTEALIKLLTEVVDILDVVTQEWKASSDGEPRWAEDVRNQVAAALSQLKMQSASDPTAGARPPMP